MKRGKETKGKRKRKVKTRVSRGLGEGMRKGEGKRKINVYRYISKLFISFYQLYTKKVAGYPVSGRISGILLLE